MTHNVGMHNTPTPIQVANSGVAVNTFELPLLQLLGEVTDDDCYIGACVDSTPGQAAQWRKVVDLVKANPSATIFVAADSAQNAWYSAQLMLASLLDPQAERNESGDSNIIKVATSPFAPPNAGEWRVGPWLDQL
jgi:hypothetical protein